MKTINTYSFSELDESAKERALQDYRSSGFEYSWQDESHESLNAFCDWFGVSVKDWSISTYNHSYIKTDADNGHFRGWNKAKVAAIPEFLTGYYLDFCFIEVFKKEFDRTGNALGAFNDAVDAGLSAWIKDMEWQESDECIIDCIEANGYQFLENGRMI